MNELNQKIEEQLLIIENKKSELEEDQELIDANWKTSGRFIMFNGEDKRLKVMERDAVIALCAELIFKKDSFDKAKSILGIEDEFLIDSFSYDDWIFDIKKRLATITKKSKLQELEKIVSSFKKEYKDVLYFLNIKI